MIDRIPGTNTGAQVRYWLLKLGTPYEVKFQASPFLVLSIFQLPVTFGAKGRIPDAARGAGQKHSLNET